MPLYKCDVLDSFGKKSIIYREANDEISLKAFLKRDNFMLVKSSIVVEKEPNLFFAVSSKIKREEVVLFLRQFAVMINASISISDALGALKQQSFSVPFRKVIMDVHHDILSGVLLSDAFARHPKVFPRFFVEMVAIGEASSSLDTVLVSMADYFERDQKVKKKTKSALAYPMILLCLIVVVILFMCLVILPQFKGIFEDFGGTVPPLTQVILAFSDFVKENILIIFFAAVGFAFLCWVFFKTKLGKKTKDFLLMHLPVIGQITKDTITARFTRAFIILLGSGMTITDCMDNLVRILENKMYQAKFKYSIEEVRRGKRIARSIENTGLFPKMLTEMINVGEKTGSLEEVLRTTADFFDTQVETTIAKAVALIEPIMIVLLGGVVALVLLSVYLPMIDLMNQI